MATKPEPRDDFGNAPGDGPLRPGGRQISEVMREKDLPSTRSRASEAMVEDLVLCRDLFAGARRVRDKNATYLPREPAETPANYHNRVERSHFYNAFRRTIEGLVGLVFRSDPILGDDVPAQISEHWENVDNAGTHGAVFARELLQDAMTAGHAAILVEFPRTDGQQTRADEVAGDIRPYWVPIKKEDIMSWQTEIRDGATRLSQVVLREVVSEADGLFGESPETRYRVLFLNDGVPAWALLKVTKDRRIELLDKGAFGNQTELPFVEVVTSGRRSILESDPPLLDLGFLNLAHYRQASDYTHAIHLTNTPLLFLAGAQLQPGDYLVVGGNQAVVQPNPAAKLEFVSHSGQSLASSKAALDDLKCRAKNHPRGAPGEAGVIRT